MTNIANYSRSILSRLKRKIILFLFERIKNVKFPFKSNRLLLVRLDSIGDYILFRNFIEVLKMHDKWGKYKITLLGNKIFKDLAEYYDSKHIDDYIWISPDIFFGNSYNKSILAIKLKLKCFDVLINPTHSRVAHQDEWFLFFGCKQRIASEGDLVNYSNKEQKRKSDSLYHYLVPTLPNNQFEFLRNRFFISSLLMEQHPVRLTIPVIPYQFIDNNILHIIIAPGAGAEFRRWSSKNFSILINSLTESISKSIAFYIVGSNQDSSIAREILSNLNVNNVTDLTGRTTLVELVSIIGSSNLLISHDSGTLHIGAATGINVICLSNGNHFGRFNPYPDELMHNVKAIYPFDYFYTSDKGERDELIEKYSIKSDLDINIISPEKVFNEVKSTVNY